MKEAGRKDLDRKDGNRRLPDTELEVMQAVWALGGPAARAEIDEILRKKHPMAQTTLLTLLSRLAEKGFLKIEKTGRSARYIPLVGKEEYQAEQSRRFLDQLFGGNLPAFALALSGSGLSREELAELRDLLDKEAL